MLLFICFGKLITNSYMAETHDFVICLSIKAWKLSVHLWKDINDCHILNNPLLLL